MGSSQPISYFIVNNFNLDYDDKEEFEKIVERIIYDSIDEKWFDFTREWYIEDQLHKKFNGNWGVNIYSYDGKEERSKIIDKYDPDERNIIIYHRVLEEGGFISDPRGEYFCIKKENGCSIF